MKVFAQSVFLEELNVQGGFSELVLGFVELSV